MHQSFASQVCKSMIGDSSKWRHSLRTCLHSIARLAQKRNARQDPPDTSQVYNGHQSLLAQCLEQLGALAVQHDC